MLKRSILQLLSFSFAIAFFVSFTAGLSANPPLAPPHKGEGTGPTLHPGFEEGVLIGSGLVQSSVAAGDIDEDGVAEIIVGGADGRLYAFNGDGTPVVQPTSAGEKGLLLNGEIFKTSDGSPILSTPTLADVDFDRRLDILFGTDEGFVYRLELILSSDDLDEKTSTRNAKRSPSTDSGSDSKRVPAPGEEDDAGGLLHR